ncbi:hypothetical protein BLA29_014314, partial [Euroglyphus maynei]
HVPVLKQVSCPQVPAAFLSKTHNNNNNNNQNSSKSFDVETNSSDINDTQPPSKPTRSYLYVG